MNIASFQYTVENFQTAEHGEKEKQRGNKNK